MPSLEEFCTITATMSPRLLGLMPQGMRLDFPFEGVATSRHWDGERPVRGIDYVIVRSDGHMDLDIRGTIGSGGETVAYQGGGISLAVSRSEAKPRELIVFQTANEDLSWLNTRIGVGLGRGEGGSLALTVYLVETG